MSDAVSEFDKNMDKSCESIADSYRSFLKSLAAADPVLLRDVMRNSFDVEVWINTKGRVEGYIERQAGGRRVTVEDPELTRTIDGISGLKRSRCVMER